MNTRFMEPSWAPKLELDVVESTLAPSFLDEAPEPF